VNEAVRIDALAEHTVPAVHVLQIVEAVRRWNVAPAALLAATGLAETDLTSPVVRLPVSTVVRIAERARVLSGEPGIGFHVGMQARVTAHGYLGLAMLTASTLREAVEFGVRFFPTRTSAVALRLDPLEGRPAIVIDEQAPLGSARDILLIGAMYGTCRIADALTGQTLPHDLDFAFPEPAYFQRFAALIPGRVRFKQRANRIYCPLPSLELPLVAADPAAFHLTREQCERELDALSRERPLVARAGALVVQGDGSVRSLPAMARALSMSVRTLKRKLQEHGTSYTELIEQRHRQRAFELLDAGLTVDEIAGRLGYSDAANFTRAFRRWTGQSPRAFRRNRA